MTWRDVTGYEGIYLVSDEGEVMRVGRTSPMKGWLQRTSGGGAYHIVSLSKDKKARSFPVHRLVAQAFLQVPEGETFEKCVVDHIDMDKGNNHVSNLEIVTHEENTRRWMVSDATRLGMEFVHGFPTAYEFLDVYLIVRKQVVSVYGRCDRDDIFEETVDRFNRGEFERMMIVHETGEYSFVTPGRTETTEHGSITRTSYR